MDDRTRQMIETYIPNPPDPTLDFMEYYYLQGGNRVIKVTVFDVWPHEDDTEYNIFQRRGMEWARIDAGYGDPFRGVRKHDLYDNRQDCKDQTHMFCDEWESLRAIQKKEALTA